MIDEIKEFLNDESGLGVIEVVLILVVVIGLVLTFKSKIKKVLDSIFKEINSKVKTVY